MIQKKVDIMEVLNGKLESVNNKLKRMYNLYAEGNDTIIEAIQELEKQKSEIKEDIEEITSKTEEVQKQFKEQFELFSSDVKFKYDFYYKQYSELYCKLYSIIIQSEYVRRYIQLTDGVLHSFEETPFLEISPTRRTTQTMEFKQGEKPKVSQKVEEIITDISLFNKKELCDYIISNGELASQELLKLAVSYRFAHNHYSGNPENKNSSTEDVANEEEFRLIKEIVFCIVKEYNYLRKELRMEYSEKELGSGIINI